MANPGLIAIKFGIDINVHLRGNCNTFGDPLTSLDL